MPKTTTGSIFMTGANIQWTIGKQECKKMKSEPICSTSFGIGKKFWEGNWYLRFYPGGNSRSKPGFFGLFLMNKGVKAKIGYRMVVSDGVNRVETHSLTTIGNGTGHGYCNMAQKSLFMDNNGDLLENQIHISCKVDSADNLVDIEERLASCELVDDFQALFHTGMNSDVTLYADGREFQAHKLILSARSEVFAAMFRHGMIENVTNSVQIDDMSSAVLQEMLQFIYTGKCTKLDALATSLLVAAERYQLKKLKEICISVMKKMLNKNNATEYLMIGDTYSASQLYISALKLIANNAEYIILSDRWNAILNSNRIQLINDVLQAVVSKKRND